MISHEAACLLNSSDTDALVIITVFFADREPAGPYKLTVPARRSKHVPVQRAERPRANPAQHGILTTLIESNVPMVSWCNIPASILGKARMP